MVGARKNHPDGSCERHKQSLPLRKGEPWVGVTGLPHPPADLFHGVNRLLIQPIVIFF
jgi:hypothetical protein